MKKQIYKNKGILFWITGLSGSGKTSIAKKIHKKVTNNYGPTLLFSGDDIRKAFNIKTYDKKNRLKLAKNYIKFCKIIVDQNINVIFATVALFHEIQKQNKKIFQNYVEIYISSEFKKVSKFSNKGFYHKNYDNIWGNKIKPEFPKKPDIVINNDFKISINDLASKTLNKIEEII